MPLFLSLPSGAAARRLALGALLAAVTPIAIPATVLAAPDKGAYGEPAAAWADPAMVDLAARSPLVNRALETLHDQVAALRDPRLRDATADALFNPQTCVAHRANLTAAGKADIIARLEGQGLLDAADGAAFPGGVADGVFPAVTDDGMACPHLSQPFFATPGGNEGGHHAWPGGLPVHEAFNLRAALDMAAAYDHQAGPAAAVFDRDLLIAAPLWHDWGKSLVMQWRPDGTLTPELRLGGHEGAADWRTGAHHILGLAEAMSRGLPPSLVLVQACAHEAPDRANADKLVHWLRTAAVIARVDPVARGYLARPTATGPTATGLTAAGPAAGTALVLPGPYAPGAVTAAGHPLPVWWPECFVHTMSDQSWLFSEPAAHDVDAILRDVAPRFGYDPADTARYLRAYRHVVLSQLGVEQVAVLAAHGGTTAVVEAITRLHAAGLL